MPLSSLSVGRTDNLPRIVNVIGIAVVSTQSAQVNQLCSVWASGESMLLRTRIACGGRAHHLAMIVDPGGRTVICVLPCASVKESSKIDNVDPTPESVPV